MFNDRARNRETFRLTFRVVMRMAFIHAVAFFADEKLSQMTMRSVAVVVGMIMQMIMVTGNKGIQGFHAMDKAVAREKF